MDTSYQVNKLIFNQGLFSTYTPILVYHQIVPEAALAGSSESVLSISRFEAQMRYLHEHGYVCVSLVDLVRSPQAESLRRKKTFVLTFDDGLEDFYDQAYPILHRYGFTATIFLITDFIKKGNDATELEKPGMNWDEINTLMAEGFCFESHTCSHARLTDLAVDELQHELSGSREYLAKNFGQEVLFLAYPYGDSNPEVQKMVRQSGYQAAFGVITVEPGRYNLWRTELKGKDSLQVFRFKLSRWYSYYIKLRGWMRERTSLGRYLRKLKHQYQQAQRA
jgi:peptidoglycan/xylan/chitin deacetylase (PgdA/CDA1 family)